MGTGEKFCTTHRARLHEWTEKELFNPRWPLGLARLGIWDRATAEISDGTVLFRLPSGAVQVARPICRMMRQG